jgi:hypothetical protein
MVHDGGPVGLDGVRVCFDDDRVVSDAGIALVATLAGRLGLEGLIGRCVRLRADRPGAANAGRKVMALVFAIVLGADSIDDCDVLRAGRTKRLLGGWMPAPSTLGTFLRAFTFGHVRQLDRVLGESLARAWTAGAGPGAERLVVDVDSFIGEVCGYQKQGSGFGYTKQAWVSPDRGLARGHRRGAARAPAARLSEHPARDAALHRRTDRPGHARRRERREVAQSGLGVLERQGLQAPRGRGLDVFDRDSHDQARW